MSNLSIIHEDNHLLAVDKPAGIATQPDDSGDPSILDQAKDDLRIRYHKPGNIFLAPVHRLDRPVSGLLLLAKTDKAAGRLAEQFRVRSTEKTYQAVVELHRPPPIPTSPETTGWRLEAELDLSDARGVRVHRPSLVPIADPDDPPEPPRPAAARGKRPATLRHAALCATFNTRWVSPTGNAPTREQAWVTIRLLTGVKHQIRAQLAAFGWPVAGDFRYGPAGRRADPTPLAGGRAIALHAHRLGFVHPTLKTRMELAAPPPRHWTALLPREVLCRL